MDKSVAPISKPCTKCGEDKRLTEFGKKRDGKYGRQAACKPCRKKQTVERLAGTVCEVEGCDNQQANRASGLCQNHYERLKKYGDPLGKGYQWDPETRPTHVYCYVHDIEGLVKVGHGDDERVAKWRRWGWTFLDSVVLPRKDARALEKTIHAIWWNDLDMTSEYDLGDRRDGADEMTEATTEAVQVALQRIAEAHKEILAAA